MERRLNIFKLMLFLFAMGLSISMYAQRNSHFRSTVNLKAGTYLFNNHATYFFDGGINCYLLKECKDIDTVFENTAKKMTFASDTILKYKAYLFTSKYEYLYVMIGKTEGWIRANVPIDAEQKNFLKKFVNSTNYPSFATYAEVIPFKTPTKVFISDADDWYIADLKKYKIVKIGTKGGRLEACQMNFKKNCVLCYIDLGWGQELWFDEDGKKCRKK